MSTKYLSPYADYPETPSLDQRSRHLRGLVVEALVGAQRGHPGPALSLIEILRVLYDDFLRYRAAEPDWPERDRCILSKGHGCLALYAILADKGFFPESALPGFCAAESFLGGHPEFGKVPGVEASTGALGHGPAIGVGMALAARLRQRQSRVVVITGDGELNEGAVWESCLSAAKHHLDNLILMVDYNKLQSYGTTAEVLDLEPLTDKFRAFGFYTVEVDGHNVDALRNVLHSLPLSGGKPMAVICHTVKGKGLPVAEGNPAWHHQAKFSDEAVNDMRMALDITQEKQA
jgi:transketolase